MGLRSWMAVLLLGGCSSGEDGQLALDGGVGGCFSLLDEQTCVTKPDARLVVWVEDTTPGLRLRHHDTPGEAVEDGTRWVVQVDGPTELVVEDPLGRPRFSLAVRPAAARWREALYAGASCAPLPDDADGDMEVFYASGRARCTEEPEPMRWLEEAIDGHRQRGDGQRLDWDLSMWAELATYWEPVPGGAWLPSQRSLESRYFWHYHHGRRANAMGNLADAHWFLEEARRMAVVMKREDQGAFFMGPATQMSSNLASAGRHEEAAALAEETIGALLVAWPERDSCEYLVSESSAAWFDAFSSDHSDRVASHLDVVDELLARSPHTCPARYATAWHAAVNRANHLARTGLPEEALALLEGVSLDAAPNDESGAWATLLTARAQLAMGHPQPVAALVAPLLPPHAPSAFTPRAHLLAAEADLAVEQREKARAHLTQSLRAVETLAARAPLGHSRGSALDSLARAAWLLAGLEADAGAPEAALAHLRAHRRRALLGLHQAVAAAHVGAYHGVRWAELRQAVDTGEGLDGLEPWERETGAPLGDTGVEDSGRLPAAVSREVERVLADGALAPAAPLRRPDSGELLVLAGVFDGTLEVWTHRQGASPARWRRPAPRTPSARLDALAEALAPHLPGIEQVTYLPLGRLRALPLERVPWQGHPLGLQLPVATSLDLGARTPSPPVGSAAVVADPTGDLAAARAEGEAIALALDGPMDVALHTGEAASEDAMVALLTGEAELLHFAGHASFADDGWSSDLALAAGAQLPAWKLLTLERVPPLVSMTACESSRSAYGATERLGLAQAFVLAGSRYVVAADVPVDDSLARTFGEAWATALARGADPPRAWLAATRATATAHPTEPWWSFRLWTP